MAASTSICPCNLGVVDRKEPYIHIVTAADRDPRADCIVSHACKRRCSFSSAALHHTAYHIIKDPAAWLLQAISYEADECMIKIKKEYSLQSFQVGELDFDKSVLS